MKTFAVLTALTTLAVAAHAGPTSHPLGVLYDLPSGWRVEATQGAYQVIRRTGQTENELYVVGGAMEPNAKTSYDPAMVAQDDEIMKALNESWKRDGGPLSFESPGGVGMLGRFQIDVEGVSLRGDLWSLVTNQRRVGVFALYPKSMERELLPQIHALATTFRPDPNRRVTSNSPAARALAQRLSGLRLIGGTTTDSGSLNGSAGSSSDRRLALLSDGTFLYTSQSATFVSAGEFSAMSESSDEQFGRWWVETEGETAYLVFETQDGTRARYTVEMLDGAVRLNGQAFAIERL